MKKSRKLFITNASCLALAGMVISTQFLTMSCTVSQDLNEKQKQQALAKEKSIVDALSEKSKLTVDEREQYKSQQQEQYQGLSIDNINQYLLDNANMSLWDYFVNLNNKNNLKPEDSNYIDPNEGILLVQDVLDGNILIQDINNQMDDYKENYHDEYVQTLTNLNLTEEQVDDAQNIDEVVADDPEEDQINKDYEDIQMAPT